MIFIKILKDTLPAGSFRNATIINLRLAQKIKARVPDMNLRTFSLIFILIHSTFFTKAAMEDSVSLSQPIATVVRYVHSGIKLDGSTRWHNLDSGLTELSNIDLSVRDHYNSLGVIGSALNPQLFLPYHEIRPMIGIRSYMPYMWSPDSLRYFRSNKRVSQIDYHNGSFKEQEIRVLHSQNILKNWSAGIDFHRFGVRDFTRNSDTYHNQVALFSWYESPNKRYNMFISAIWNTFKNQVNGGLKNDSLYESGAITNLGLKGLNIELADAKHQFRNHEFSLSNSYDFIRIPDSTVSNKRKINSFQFVHSINFESGSYAYSDGVSDSSFYEHFYSGISTYDSLHYYDFKNSAGFFLPRSDSSSAFFFRHFSTLVQAEYQWFEYRQRDVLYQDNYILKGSLFSPVNDTSFSLRSSAEFIFAGTAIGKYKFDAHVASPLFKIGSLFAGISVLRREADQLLQNYYSNHFIWNNSFHDIHSQSIHAGLKNKRYKFQLEVLLHRLENYVYAGSDATPSQYGAALEITQFRIIKNFKFRDWHLDNEAYFQNSGDEEVLRIPSYCGKHSLYLEKVLFNKALKAQFGFIAHYNSAYYADRFMPATSLFYLQNQRKTGAYALIDFFVHLKIKSARIFLKIENIGDGLVADRYYLSPEYPQPGRTIKFGLSWRFFDM
jgi:hypothetical protein